MWRFSAEMGKGVVSECYPGAVGAASLQFLTTSCSTRAWKLDGTLGNERIIAVFCAEAVRGCAPCRKAGAGRYT